MLEITEGRVRSAPLGAWVVPIGLWFALVPGAVIGIVNAIRTDNLSTGQWILTAIVMAVILLIALATTLAAVETIRRAERDGDALLIRGPGVEIRGVHRRCRLEIFEVASTRSRMFELRVIGQHQRRGKLDEFLLVLDDARWLEQAREIAEALGVELVEDPRAASR